MLFVRIYMYDCSVSSQEDHTYHRSLHISIEDLVAFVLWDGQTLATKTCEMEEHNNVPHCRTLEHILNLAQHFIVLDEFSISDGSVNLKVSQMK